MRSSGKLSLRIKFLVLTIVTIILFVALGLLGNSGDTKMIWAVVLGSIVMSLLFYFLQIKMLIRPLAEIEEVVKLVKGGDFEARLDVDSCGGIGDLGANLNLILDKVTDKIYWYESLLDAIPWPISVTDMDMNWTFINKAAADVTSSTREEVVGKQCNNWGADICNTERCGIECLRRGEETSFFTQPGLNMDFKVDTAYLTDKEGQHVGHIEIVQDITEANEMKRKAEQALKDGMLMAADKLGAIVENITSASEQLSSQVEGASQGAETQRELAAETATAMEEMNTTVLEVARNAGDAASNADITRSNAEEGSDVVENVVKSIAEISRRVEGMQQNVNELGDQAQGIGQIMDVITDIADQTNLLALNAAIEAARAGEAGRGFAVVADEVRKLAEKTMQATTEVGQSISAIQGGTKNSIENMEMVVEVVNKSTDLAQKSGVALEGILRLAEGTSDQVSAIATASEEQASTAEEISRHTEQINQISSETSVTMSQATEAITDLARQAGELQRLIEELRQA
ncbi:methyl-accepting chemotaxis protein [Maridesulfovibrio sp.]|uniref:methyl-accepting chemotaxis protein n=1 Tax=Maridesulfovibrio sp. TaxID=2795000 RepID=UPI002AA7EB7B|nr:methyl-accepting chemotaxis protein [Maridesulfovibrio sp.]